MANGTQYIQGRDGKFKGSVGGGKGTVAPSVKPSVPQTPRTTRAAGKQSLADEVANATFDQKERWSLHKNSSPQRLTLLASDPAEPIRYFVARNPKTPAEVLGRLASDDSPQVRRQLAFNENLPEVVQEKLARDEKRSVRVAVATSPHTHPAVLADIAYNSDNDDDLRGDAIDNSHFPARFLADFENDPNPDIRVQVAMRLPDGVQTPHILDRMAGDDVWQVRYNVTWNRGTTEETVKRLTADSNPTVARKASFMLSLFRS